MSARGENVDCGDGREDNGVGDVADAGADDGGSIPRDGRRGAGEGREVEGEDVEDGEGHLGELSTGEVWQHAAFVEGEPTICVWDKPAVAKESLHTERTAAVFADNGAGGFASSRGMST